MFSGVRAIPNGLRNRNATLATIIARRNANRRIRNICSGMLDVRTKSIMRVAQAPAENGMRGRGSYPLGSKWPPPINSP
jgi:hypothetical protein